MRVCLCVSVGTCIHWGGVHAYIWHTCGFMCTCASGKKTMCVQNYIYIYKYMYIYIYTSQTCACCRGIMRSTRDYRWGCRGSLIPPGVLLLLYMELSMLAVNHEEPCCPPGPSCWSQGERADTHLHSGRVSHRSPEERTTNGGRRYNAVGLMSLVYQSS